MLTYNLLKKKHLTRSSCFLSMFIPSFLNSNWFWFYFLNKYIFFVSKKIKKFFCIFKESFYHTAFLYGQFYSVFSKLSHSKNSNIFTSATYARRKLKIFIF